jgi:hypothetical protein
VEGLADFFGGDDADGMRQHGIHAALKFGGGEIGMGFEMRDLAEGVDSGVGAAGAVDGDALLSDFLEGVFEGALDGGDLGLELPAVEVGAVVGDGEFDVLHFVARGLSHERQGGFRTSRVPILRRRATRQSKRDPSSRKALLWMTAKCGARCPL